MIRQIVSFTLLSVMIMTMQNCNQRTPKDLEVGQRWSFQTRGGDSNATVLILKVEQIADSKRVAHIRIDGLSIEGVTPEKKTSTIQHLPFDYDALRKDLISVMASGEAIPQFDGYYQWKKAYDAGKAGVFTTTVEEAVGFVEKANLQARESVKQNPTLDEIEVTVKKEG
jgi:hypothetical protein